MVNIIQHPNPEIDQRAVQALELQAIAGEHTDIPGQKDYSGEIAGLVVHNMEETNLQYSKNDEKLIEAHRVQLENYGKCVKLYGNIGVHIESARNQKLELAA